MEKERDSGIELLRIFASMLVIILHFNLSGAINCSLGTNRLLLFGLESLGICAVDLFLIITGYFSAHSKKSSLLKLLDLFGQLLFLRLGFYFVEIFLFHKNLSILKLIMCFIPNNYYLIFYAVVVCMAPYINIIFSKLVNKQLDYFIMILVGLFSIYPYIIDTINYFLAKNYYGIISDISTVTRGGALDGYTIVNFLLMYCIGAYIRIKKEDNKLKFNCGYLFVILLVSFLTILVSNLYSQNNVYTPDVFLAYESPFVIMEAVVIFFLFLKLSVKNEFVNKLARASYMCY